MSGHSKWATIKRKKEKTDAKRGKIFSRVSKEIINAVKLGGSADIKANARLRIAIQHAKSVNFPAENIERVIKKADEQGMYHEMQYELYGHGGVGIILDVMTDNKNRIASEVRIATNKRGGTIAVPGAVSFNFAQKGRIVFEKEHAKEEALFEAATLAGAQDFIVEDDAFVIITETADFYSVKEAVEKLGVPADESDIEMIPLNAVAVDAQTFQANIALIEWLESIDDVDAVYHNMIELVAE